ncbi:170aa long hypothetical protein [Pyrococcus horikoshii OT3]|uniref:Uncharacterized protein n=1 Tax=Pyrococcus horikoshii (strain ATCC 700860 / DSM 12428 / JCM 9974 / NBRC 100139 / OT-3) TaxID=70601 RepID=O58757_PYRHO|nr:170aa long hypothetical protein [Pyrococcus horikoshii OT3]
MLLSSIRCPFLPISAMNHPHMNITSAGVSWDSNWRGRIVDRSSALYVLYSIFILGCCFSKAFRTSMNASSSAPDQGPITLSVITSWVLVLVTVGVSVVVVPPIHPLATVAIINAPTKRRAGILFIAYRTSINYVCTKSIYIFRFHMSTKIGNFSLHLAFNKLIHTYLVTS